MNRATLALLCATFIAASISAAEARPRHHYHHHKVHRHHQYHHRHHKIHYRTAMSVPAQEQPNFFSGFGSGGSTLVSRARSYVGETARQVGVRTTLWCSAFIRKLTKAKGVDDRARSWLNKPRTSPRVGAIAVMGRRGGGHVGIVSGFTKNGDPILISGNHNGRVAESVYPRSRILAWVSPS